MADGFHWAPKRVRLRSRIALGVAVMRIGVGLIVLVAGVALALMHFRPPPEPAAIEKIILAHQADDGLTTASIDSGPSSEGKGRAPTAIDAWERRTIVVGRAEHLTDAVGPSVASDEVLDGYELTRALQAELQRVGCYHGAIDGDWGPMSKRAMGNFTKRVNASLPVDEPDNILLRMVRDFQGQACGSCPSGETQNADGRCVAGTILARESGSGEPSAEPLPGRMSIGGPFVAIDEGESLTRQSGEETRTRPRRRPRMADRSLPPPSYRAPRRERPHWTETIFDEISRR